MGFLSVILLRSEVFCLQATCISFNSGKNVKAFLYDVIFEQSHDKIAREEVSIKAFPALPVGGEGQLRGRLQVSVRATLWQP